jgi:hypothetical protein
MRPFLPFILLLFSHSIWAKTNTDSLPNEPLQRLIQAYPKQLSHVAGNYLVWKDGTKMLIDDGLIKNEDMLFDSADIEDQINELRYMPGYCPDTPSYGCNPGTYRCIPFFQKMYGSTEAEVRRHLTTLWWPSAKGGQKLVVTTVNNVHLHLKAVADELNAKPHLRQYIVKIGGGFNWRYVAGTTRPSPHSYGIAIDINTRHSHYWRWDHPDTDSTDAELNLRWHNTIPWEIVEIFEKHGFIWGGKWYHYDTMHFEYRPELIDAKEKK